MTDLILNGLATWRLVKLMHSDQITADAREKIIGWTLERGYTRTRTLIQCPHCLAPYCATLLLCLQTISPKGSKPIVKILALSGMVSLCYEMLESRTG